MAKSKSSASTDRVTVAVVQAASVAFDHKRTLVKALDLTRDAARQGAKLVLFPEAFISGYPRGLDFGAVVGARSDEGREDFRRYFESAVDVPGPTVDALSKAARANSVYLVMGVIERERGTLYCCVLFFAPDGTFLGKHRKVMPTASERLIWGYGDGSTLPVFSTPFGRLGAVICWENYMPLLRTYMYAQGIDIYCAPTADHRETWSATMQHIAAEGRCFVLGCNQFNRRRDFPKRYRTAFGDAPDTVISRGGSCIVDPFGKFLAGPNFQDETILVAELDRSQLPKAKFDFDAVGHYSRPDIFRLVVDDRPKVPVSKASLKAGRE
ncbi:MAG TPA: nitrilase-related carbon-nitrogen hydrolase [Candidatus Angelobacter sp.]|nr:nitrilase-related carbon-nitrogen hydrolase [Candidatus Angelobacter sp.]